MKGCYTCLLTQFIVKVMKSSMEVESAEQMEKIIDRKVIHKEGLSHLCKQPEGALFV